MKEEHWTSLLYHARDNLDRIAGRLYSYSRGFHRYFPDSAVPGELEDIAREILAERNNVEEATRQVHSEMADREYKPDKSTGE